MKDNVKYISGILILLIIIGLIIIPNTEFKIKNKLIAIRYKEDMSEFETNECYNERYYYNKKHNISISGFNHTKILFLNIYTFDYIERNICKTEYLLEESYIKNFLENAIIEYNSLNIDVAKLIDGKKAIIGNTKYLGNDYTKEIYYILDGKHEVMYIYEKNDLLIIQVGLSDEGPKYIAYK